MIHLYPARMHPEIAKRIICKYSTNDTIVFDPFMGSGGVLLECILAGYDSIGLDINPFAVLLSKVKTTPINNDLAWIRNSILNQSIKDCDAGEYHSDLLPDMDVGSWYGDDVARKLSTLKYHTFNVKDADVRDFFKICLSLTIRKSSYQKNGSWKIHRMRDREKFNPDPVDMFAKITNVGINKMNNLVDAAPKGKAYPVFGDTRNTLGSFNEIRDVLDNSVKMNLMITSPPYGDHYTTVAYGQFSKHSGLWLDLPLDYVKSVDKIGLGGRFKHNESDLDSPSLNSTLKSVRENDLKLTKIKNLAGQKRCMPSFLTWMRAWGR